MTGIIEIEGMEFFAYHGCFEAEQIVGNKFMVYACLHYNCHCPASNIGKQILAVCDKTKNSKCKNEAYCITE